MSSGGRDAHGAFGLRLHSALAVARTETLREGDAVRVRILLVLARKGVRRQGGDLCHLTASLLYQAQDAEIADLRICASPRGAEWIDVQFQNFGKDEVIPYRLTKTPAGWRIADQVFESGVTLVGLLAKPL